MRPYSVRYCNQSSDAGNILLLTWLKVALLANDIILGCGTLNVHLGLVVE